MATGGEESDEEWRGVGAQCDRKLEDINLSYNLYVKTKDLCKVTYGTRPGPVLWDVFGIHVVECVRGLMQSDTSSVFLWWYCSIKWDPNTSGYLVFDRRCCQSQCGRDMGSQHVGGPVDFCRVLYL